MRSVFRYMLLALVLLVVALVSALTTMRFAIRGREVIVPNLVGKTPAEAHSAAESSSLQIEVERQFYSPTIPAGRIISQIPVAGARVKRGWQLRVATSLGPQRVEILNVLGQSERAAELNLRRRGLDLGSIATIAASNAPPDQVLAQSPPPNASGVSVPKISLLVAQAAEPQAFVMPSLVGQTLAGATASLQNAGMRVGNVAVLPVVPAAAPTNAADTTSAEAPPPALPAPPANPASIVVSQSPIAGEKIAAGSSVSLQVR